MNTLPTTDVKTCTNCAATVVDVYCAKCGERQPDHHDLTIGHFAHEAVHELVHLDSKLFGTLRALVRRPGLLTQEYFAGRKKRYIAPLRLFLTLFAIFFIAYTAYKPVNVYSLEAIERFDKEGRAKLTEVVERLAAKQKLAPDVYRERVDDKWRKYVSYSQLANILGLAVVLKVLFRRRTSVEHLVFSAHFLSFTYLLSIAIWPVYYVIGFRPGPAQSLFSTITTIAMTLYGAFALRRYYEARGARLVVKSVLFYAGTFVVTLIMMVGALVAAMIAIRS